MLVISPTSLRQVYGHFSARVPELEDARTGGCQNWRVPELEGARTGGCQNWRVPELEGEPGLIEEPEVNREVDTATDQQTPSARTII